MKVGGKVAVVLIRTLLHLICKVDRKEIKKIPKKGPCIVAINHINFLEVPMIFVDLYPRKIHGIAKKETWDISFMAWLADIWESIPIDREGFTASTFRKAKKLLQEGRIIIIAPEGTRTGDGKLKEAHPGIITMALQSNVPIIPVVHYGGERFWHRITKLKRTSFTFKVGNPIRLKKPKLINHLIRRKMVDQLMYRMARLLPEYYRGVYDDIGKINNKYVEDAGFGEI
ncbi:MAG: lysophospholipid acyltransferase family protein [Candidatus Cloacimonadales bacterium]|nr:lysophospholipid acyltransferase family protein [Candidatus Cloacimonadales bacterium]